MKRYTIVPTSASNTNAAMTDPADHASAVRRANMARQCTPVTECVHVQVSKIRSRVAQCRRTMEYLVD